MARDRATSPFRQGCTSVESGFRRSRTLFGDCSPVVAPTRSNRITTWAYPELGHPNSTDDEGPAPGVTVRVQHLERPREQVLAGVDLTLSEKGDLSMTNAAWELELQAGPSGPARLALYEPAHGPVWVAGLPNWRRRLTMAGAVGVVPLVAWLRNRSL
jgi:hypothetical protein